MPTSCSPARATPSARSSTAADSGKPLPHFALPARLKATAAVKHADVVSQNVVAMLPGSDPKLKDEYVVFTAHLDHLGIGKPINGDAIYNGAMDNASGDRRHARRRRHAQGERHQAAPIGAVRRRDRRGEGPARLASSSPTAPTVDPKAIVADINTDMFLPLFPLKKLTIYGLDESDLGAEAEAAARVARRRAAARPGAEAECLHPQRPVQLHPPRRAGAGAEGRLSTRARPRSRSRRNG